MNNINLFNKYRPRKFTDIAQPHVTRVLRASVIMGDYPSSYLMIGSNGTGKTSTARVLAMAVLCGNRSSDGEPCGECLSCRMIIDDTHRDVNEINCGTNGKVEETRALISDEIMLAPVYGSKRVLILDEAANLTSSAQDSLLKTLEEPPPHVIFILCTTDPEKLKKTIRSRCQIHRLKRVADVALKSILTNIVQLEAIQADQGGLDLIIQDAQGSARQALSTLEQVKLIGASEKNVRDVLGRAPSQMAVDLLVAISEGSEGFAKSFQIVDVAKQEGHDLIALLEEACRILATVARVRLLKIPLADCSENVRLLAPQYTGSVIIETVNNLMEIISKVRQNVPADLAVQFGILTTIQRFVKQKASAAKT